MQDRLISALQAVEDWQKLCQESETRLSQQCEQNNSLGLELEQVLGLASRLPAASTTPVCMRYSLHLCASCLHSYRQSLLLFWTSQQLLPGSETSRNISSDSAGRVFTKKLTLAG